MRDEIFTCPLKILAMLFPMACAIEARAQAEASIWYFGRNVIMDLSTAPPSIDTISAMWAPEGSTGVASGVAGPLFYADGYTVCNALHQPMPNGTGLMGHWSSTQTALAVPFPGDATKYYLFNTDAGENGGTNGLRYSLIDMTLDGGHGDVTAVKNVLLTAPTTEKLTAVRHANGTDYWVLTRHSSNNDLMAFQVSAAGVDPTPVVSSFGPSPTHAIGQMKFSPDGTKVAAAQLNSSTDIQLFHFDAATGVVSDPLDLESVDFQGSYGIEFSPDGNQLYMSCEPLQTLYQFDLSVWTATTVLASATLVGTTADDRFGSLQLAPDGKIYVAHCDWPIGGTHLGVIEQPEVAGAGCNYVDLAVDMLGTRCFFGLPSFVQSYFDPEIAQCTTSASSSQAFALSTFLDDELTVHLPAGVDHWSVLTLFDATGRGMIVRGFNGLGSLTINDPLPSGAYVLLINDGTGQRLASGRVIAIGQRP